LQIAARGFKDTTRIAASDPDVWREILVDNRAALRASLTAFRTALDDLERLVMADDGAALTAFLARVKAMRERLS
jgi:prephenate dehydrogenase